MRYHRGAVSASDNLYSEVQQIEEQLLALKMRRTELFRQMPREEVGDYSFSRASGGTVQLSELFAEKSDLLLIHNMGRTCPYCTLWADGFQSMLPHLLSRTSFALVSNDDPETAAEFAQSRNWTFTVVSGKDNPFTKDMGFFSELHGSWPGVSAFRKDPDGTIRRTGWLHFGPGDDFCATWHFFDLLEGGVGDWEPKIAY